MSKDNFDRILDRAFRPKELYFLLVFFVGSLLLALLLGAWATMPILIVVSILSLLGAIYEWCSNEDGYRGLVAPIVFSNIVMWCAYLISTHPGVFESGLRFFSVT